MTTPELDKRYSPAEIEQRWYSFWEAEGLFTADAESTRPSFTMVIPPPNVTGRLHIGHALVNTLQDIVARWKRMSGFNTLWLPGTDHAGIATQMVVERELAKEGLSRHEIGREKFVERVWQWKEDHGAAITNQLKRLGVSCDWSRERFTLDEGLSRAVRHVFVRLYEDGLIYRDTAIVNWCPRCRTAISEIEVEFKETEGKLYLIDYPVVPNTPPSTENRAPGTDYLTVATTRPETMLGDTAVAVHPDDERYRHLIGGEVVLPLTGRRIPIISDSILVDPAFGTGVVKITPSHDKNDYAAGLRHSLSQIQVIDQTGKMSPAAGAEYEGLDRFEARTRVIAALEEQGVLREVKAHQHAVGACAKCDTVIEPMVSPQWFVRIEPLAGPALEAVRNGSVKLTPQSWDATYFHWMENIHDWCISRQLWWGHRIPAFHCLSCRKISVLEDVPQSCPECHSEQIEQETDVLDTWFSSALWPFSTMGWPDKTRDLQTFYPTNVLITGFDILFFWVARMLMMGIRFTGQPPFTQVFLNGLVRDEHGQKMSKSRGNVIDPLEVVDEFGADAVRLTLAILSSGRDIPLAKNRMLGYAGFGTKVWNASRFALMHIDTESRNCDPLDVSNLGTVDRWILSRFNETATEVNRALTAFRFDEASNAIYQFFWHELCDWYIEMAKPVLMGRHGEQLQQETKRTLLVVLDGSLRLLHPFMPFITEEIWQKLNGKEPSIMVAPFPMRKEEWESEEASQIIEIAKELITRVRNLRAERGFAPSDRFRLVVKSTVPAHMQFFQNHGYVLKDLARLSDLTMTTEPIAENLHRDSVGSIEFGVEFPEKQISADQQARQDKQIEQIQKELESARVRLADPNFTGRAPAKIVEQTREREQELLARLETLGKNQTVAN